MSCIISEVVSAALSIIKLEIIEIHELTESAQISSCSIVNLLIANKSLIAYDFNASD